MFQLRVSATAELLASVKIGALELLPRAMADVEDLHLLLPFYDVVDHSIDMASVAVEQVSEPFVLWRCRATVGA
jgi:hypothetical protein